MAGGVAFTRDLSAWPIATWRVHRRLTVPEVETMVRSLSEVLARREPYVLVLSATELRGESSLPPEARRIQAEWVRLNHVELSRHCRGMVMVNDLSPVLHFAASLVVSLMGRMPAPWKMVASEDVAMTWARGQLAKKAVAVATP